MNNEKMDMLTPTLALDIEKDFNSELDVDIEEQFRQNEFTEDEKKQIEEFAAKIDLYDASLVISYGANSQQRLADFSEMALQSVRTKDTNEVGDILSGLVADLKFDTTEKKGFLGLVRKGANKVENIRAHYTKVGKNVDTVSEVLKKHRNALMKDVAVLEKLFEKNKAYFKELTMYIAAGKIALQKAVSEELPRLNAKAIETGLPEDAQIAQDYAAMCDRFDKKLNDLAVSRTICLQNAPQIRLVQNNDIMMTDKINSTLVTVIPLWKNQLVLSLGLAHSQDAIKIHTTVTNATNELLKTNADILQQTTAAVARENERNIVDIDTLKYSNEKLMSTIDELLKIQNEGREKRRSVEAELIKIEDAIREKLVESSGVK